MYSKHQYSIFLFCIFFIFISCEKKEVIVDDDPIILEGPFDETVTTIIFSPYVNENYELKYFIPAAYEENKNLPAIYVLDGIYMFDKVLSYTKDLDFDAIIVAIGNRAPPDRNRDFFPCVSGEPAEGYLNFYKLLTNTLIDFIDTRLEYDRNSRTLLGWSLGGGFVIHTLFSQFENEKRFRNFLAVDPTDCGENLWGELYKNNDFATDPDQVYNLFMGRGEFFLPDDLAWLVELIDSKDHPYLNVQYNEYPTLDHEEIWKPNITDGLRYIYDL